MVMIARYRIRYFFEKRSVAPTNATGKSAHYNSSLFQQRWDRIRITRVDSGWILRFSFGPGVKNLAKTGPGSGVTFQFRQQQESVWSFLK